MQYYRVLTLLKVCESYFIDVPIVSQGVKGIVSACSGQ